MTDALAS